MLNKNTLFCLALVCLDEEAIMVGRWLFRSSTAVPPQRFLPSICENRLARLASKLRFTFPMHYSVTPGRTESFVVKPFPPVISDATIYVNWSVRLCFYCEVIEIFCCCVLLCASECFQLIIHVIYVIVYIPNEESRSRWLERLVTFGLEICPKTSVKTGSETTSNGKSFPLISE